MISLKSNRAFSLVEVTLALGIASFCLIAILGLIPVGLSSTQAALEQTQASNIISAIVTDMKLAPAATVATASPRFGIAIPAASAQMLYFKYGGDGDINSTARAAARYQVQIIFNTTAINNRKTPLTGTIKVAWPAAANLAQKHEQGSVSTFFALDRY